MLLLSILHSREKSDFTTALQLILDNVDIHFRDENRYLIVAVDELLKLTGDHLVDPTATEDPLAN